jgi:glycosyltransferase involved in cell wall biosynthesis
VAIEETRSGPAGATSEIEVGAPDARGSVFIVVPAYNEEARIRSVLMSLLPLYPQVVVVDDCSRDRTFERVSELPVHALRHVVNLGQGAALQTGTEYALKHGADVVVHFDADGQHRSDQIEKLIAPILSGEVEMTLGSRFLGERSDLPWMKRVVLLPVGRIVNWLFTGLYLSDAHNGYRALGRRAAGHLSLRQNRMAHATEILALVRRHGIRFREVPVLVTYDEFGQGLAGGLKIVRDLVYRSIFR